MWLNMWYDVKRSRLEADETDVFISGSVRGEGDVLSIIGRCGQESIRQGAEFRAIVREKPRRYPDGLTAPREIERCQSICIRVQEIEAYGKRLNLLPANTTGILRCVDCLVDLVPGGWILTDSCVSVDESKALDPKSRCGA